MSRAMCRMVLALAAIFAVCAAQAAEVTKGEVTEVTVYRDQALVTRTIKVEWKRGAVEIVVTELPEKIIPASLSGESQGKSKIHSVTYRTKAVEGETRPEVKEIDGKVAALEKQLREIDARKELLKAKSTLVEKLEAFTASTSEVELQRGVLNFEELRKLAEYGLDKYEELMQEGLELSERKKEIEKEIDLLRRRRAELTKGFSRLQREAVVYLTKDVDQPVTINLSYVVSQVGWYPQYNLRSDDERDSVRVEYNALVRQMSGEDWTNVKLTFSTAEPTYASEPPIIEPLEVALGPLKIFKEAELQRQLKENIKARIKSQKAGAQAERSQLLNIAAVDQQMLEFNVDAGLLRWREREIRRMEGVSATYMLAQPVSLASRTDEQILQIAALSMPAEFTHVGAPVLTDFVFEEAKVTNTSGVVFLPGSSNSYLDGQFVGRGSMKLVAGGEDFETGFGVDPQVRLVKELVAKKEHIEGGNKVSEFEYKLIVSNYGNKEIPLRLEDRIPYSADDSIQIKLLEAKPEISKDEEYQETGLKKGLLRWNLKIPARAINDKAVVVTYRFSMAHEKQMAVRGK